MKKMREYLNDVVEKERIRKTLSQLSIGEQIELYFQSMHEYDGDTSSLDLYKEIYKQYQKKYGVQK